MQQSCLKVSSSFSTMIITSYFWIYLGRPINLNVLKISSYFLHCRLSILRWAELTMKAELQGKVLH